MFVITDTSLFINIKIKTISDFVQEHETINIKAGIINGEIVGLDTSKLYSESNGLNPSANTSLSLFISFDNLTYLESLISAL